MFTVKKVTTFEGCCPNGHPPLPELLPQTNLSVGFCHICGVPIEKKPVPYDAPYCAECDKPVDPVWDYCPYCGGKKG